MPVTIKSAKGPMHQDIYPIIARSKDELEKCYEQLLDFIKEKGGVDVYRIPEGVDKSVAGLQDGDIIIVPLGGKVSSKNDDLVLVATYTGEAKDVLPHFRFKTKRKWNKENLPYPPAPKQHIDKYADQETVKNRPDKAPPTTTSSIGGTGRTPDGKKEIYSVDLATFTAKVFHYMPEYKKRKEVPNPDSELLVIKVDVSGNLAKLLNVSEGVTITKKTFSSLDVTRIALDLDADVVLDENSAEVKMIHDSLLTFLGESGKIDETVKDTWQMYRTCLSMMKTYVEMEFLSEIEATASKERNESCVLTSYAKDEYDKKEMEYIDDLETDRDIITDLLYSVGEPE